MSFNNGYGVDPATRVKVTRAAAEAMLDRATRITTYQEARNHGMQAMIPVDTFRMNLMALVAALDGENQAERLAIDDEGAGALAEILREAEGVVTATFSAEWIETARQLYGAAALAGKEVESFTSDDTAEIPRQLYRPVAAAAMMLGELLTKLHRDPVNGADQTSGSTDGR